MSDKIDQLKANPSFCSMAWMHQFIDPSGRVKPCCRYDESVRPKEIDLNEDSLRNLFHGQWMSEVREKMLAGDSVIGCRRCYEEEKAGKKSLRQRYNDSHDLPVEQLIDLEKPKLRWLELAISNQCNLACRMCDSRYSWKWYDEEVEAWGEARAKTKIVKIDIANVDPFIQDLVHIKFTGGEPLITPEHWKILDKLQKNRDCSEIFLNYSTNCTIMPKPEWVELWKKFKFIEFALSFDSLDPRESEYIRWPAKFEKTLDVTKFFLELGKDPKFRIILRSTISIQNIWHLPETIDWWYQHAPQKLVLINPTHLTYPEVLSVTVLPRHIKRRIAEKFQPYIDGPYPQKMRNSLAHMVRYMNSEDHSFRLPKLKAYLDKTDAYRKQSFFESYPHFYDIFEGVRKHDAIPAEPIKTNF